MVVCCSRNAVPALDAISFEGYMWYISVSSKPWQPFPPWMVPVGLPLFSASLLLQSVCRHCFPKNFPCFWFSWHLLPLPHMFPVYEEIHVSFQPLCLLKKSISWWYILLLITPLFRNLLATIQMEMFCC